MYDFTIKIYRELLKQFAERDCYTFAEFVEQRPKSGIVLRHDVDKRPEQSLAFARLQHEFGIKGTYYFRIVKESFDPRIIEEIAEMGHEVGYHYEDLSLGAKREKGKGKREKGKRETGGWGGRKSKVEGQRSGDDELFERAIESFARNLARMREVADIRTICMHGSPLSRRDSRMLWERYDYRDYGIIGEPYFDIDFERVAYHTDTGRRWDGGAVSVRDKPMEAGKGRKEQGKRKKGSVDLSPFSVLPFPSSRFPVFHSTFDMIQALKAGTFPLPAMLTFHPQRWTDKPGLWVKELVGQRVKNGVKRVVVRNRG